ncbi:hypothetical protein BLA29_000291 [Euroglyphus maynei]|uniref:Dynein light chain n=1 Tax=Euroglyphus maynei TaxID=6958 RepID=A0A1Y3B2X5_EURMA|nr:hypothetical protein BLA29_000291 [Euroglyphus maynei]
MTTEKCYFHANGKTTDSKSIFYGQCMSMNGPDGCCLEGHYKPGICTNLGHICCIKPDPECNAMFTNKGITKSALRQYGHLFRKFNQDLTMKNNDQNSNENNHNGQQRAIRSNPKQFKYIYNTNFEIVEMPAHMQLDAVTFVVDALDRFNGDFDDAADYLCRMLDQKYEQPSPWSCTIGRDFGYSVDPLPGKYMLFYIGNDVRVMAFVSKNEN